MLPRKCIKNKWLEYQYEKRNMPLSLLYYKLEIITRLPSTLMDKSFENENKI